MKAIKLFSSFLIIILFMTACNNNNTTEGTSPGTDTTIDNPTKDAQDYHPDQSQHIPTPDSSNTIGTDTINGSVSTPNTGTEKSYNTTKGTKDSTE